jgi:hypothetical protein
VREASIADRRLVLAATCSRQRPITVAAEIMFMHDGEGRTTMCHCDIQGF